jgi:hypothetical protein
MLGPANTVIAFCKTEETIKTKAAAITALRREAALQIWFV